MRCIAISLSKQIKINTIEKLFSEDAYDLHKYIDCLQVYHRQHHMLCHIFTNGTFVSWHRRKNDHLPVLDVLLEHISVLDEPISESFFYQLGNKTTITPHPYFKVEMISLSDDSHEIKLSISYSLSQSIKLHSFEQQIENLITIARPNIEILSKKSRKLRYKNVKSIIAKILMVKSEINLNRDIVYEPKIFWLYSSLEPTYTMAKTYLDIPERIETLNTQLDTLYDTYDMFDSYFTSRHSHFLEWIIIVLISMEIILSILHFS